MSLGQGGGIGAVEDVATPCGIDHLDWESSLMLNMIWGF
jgi:hypothetical protein